MKQQPHIKGKTVAIVGRSEYLNSMKQGEFIDSHDVVIRAHSNLPYPSEKFVLDFDNDHSFVPQDYQRLIGKNTTGFAPANMPYWGGGYCDKIIPKLLQFGIEYLIQHKVYNLCGPFQIATVDYITDKFGMPIIFTPHEQLVRIIRDVDYTFPMPGTILIDFIAGLQPQSLYCTGFGCYQDTDERWLKSEVAITRDHKTLYDLRYLRDMTNERKWMSVDSEMERFFDNI